MKKQLSEMSSCPQEVVRVAELPRNQMGKVQKVELRRRYNQLFALEQGHFS